MEIGYFQDMHKTELESITKEMIENSIFEATFKNKYGAIKITKL